MTTKFKANMTLNSLKETIKLKCLFEFSNHFIKISIIDKLNLVQTELIKGIFMPLNHSKLYEFYMNYAFINNINSYSDKKNCILLEINNPVIGNIFPLILSDLEGISILFKKKINISQIIIQIKKKIKEEIKFLIYGFNNMIFGLINFLEKNKNIKILEQIREQAYKFGKKYYESAAINFKKNNKIAKNINDYSLVLKLKTLEQNLSQQEKMKKNICYTSFESLLSEFKIRTTYFIQETIVLLLKIICIGINSFDDINFNKFNLNKIFDINNNQNNNNININNNKNNKNKNKSFTLGINKINNNININNDNDAVLNKISEQNNINNKYQKDDYDNENENENDNSTKGTSKKNKNKKIYISQDDTKIQTPKFKQFNYKSNNHALDNFSKNYYNDLNNKNSLISINPLENVNNITKNIINKKIVSLNGINKEIEELCNVHALLIPDGIFNLFCNAAEIIHRKFFQIVINNYLGNIFYLEEDKEGNIKIEDLYNYFLYIRALKLMLFNSDKKKYFLSNLLIEDMMI